MVAHNIVFFCIASWITFGCSFLDSNAQWRVPLLIQLVPVFVMVFLLPLIPESPRWLLMHDKVTEAQKSLQRLLGKDLALNNSLVTKELKSIEGAIMIERQSKISFLGIILCKDRSRHLRRMLLGCGGQIMQQFVGTEALYIPMILTENIDMDDTSARLFNACNATILMIFSGLSFWMIERFGRRSLLLGGLCGEGLSYTMISISLALKPQSPEKWRINAIFFLFLSDAVFGCTWGMVPWVYQSEVCFHRLCYKN